MATQRRFGPTLGAGVVVIEKEAARLIQPAPLGVTLYVTPVMKGYTAKLNSCYTKRDFYRKCGNRFPGAPSGLLGPNCAYDFFNQGQGAGELHIVRVAAGTGTSTPGGQLRAAQVDLWSREITSPTNENNSAGYGRPVIRVTAASGGTWAGRRRVIHRHVVSYSADILATTLATALTMLGDEWVGGFILLDGVPTKRYAITGNTTSGVVSVSSDSNMAADLAAASSTNSGYTLFLDQYTNPNTNVEYCLGIQLSDGQTNPTTEFGMQIFVDGLMVRQYPDLNMDPTSLNYFATIINGDQTNFDITVTDLLTPANPDLAVRRPANAQQIASAVTPTTLTSDIFQVRQITGVSNPTFALADDTDAMRFPDTLTFTCTGVALGNATFTCTSGRLNGGGSIVASAVSAANTNATVFTFTSTDPNLPNWTMTCGSTVFSSGDQFEVDYMPLDPNTMVNGYLCPDFNAQPTQRFRIIANTHKVITVQSGDLTVQGGAGTNSCWMAFWPQQNNWTDVEITLVANNGYDATSGLEDSDYTTVPLNSDSSTARRLLNEDKGLVKCACPDNTSTAVLQNLLQFVENLNWQGRIEMPVTILTEGDAVNYVNNTIGRNDFGVVTWPSYATVPNPDMPGQTMTAPLTGLIHGAEALIAKTYNGYHKAEAGIDVQLTTVLDLPTGDLVFNEEITNPQGVNVAKWYKGQVILWGDRTISSDPSWRWKHQREQMSHYENQLREGFAYVIFSINNQNLWQQLLTTLSAFFRPEFIKGALSGNKFSDAATFKIDSENNTAQDAADGDLNCDISLALAGTVERFIISISNAGIFDNVSS